MNPIRIECRFFSLLREKLEKSSLTIELSEAITAGELLEQLAEQENFKDLLPFIKLAINRQYRPHSTLLADQDELAFITPVAGG